MGIATPNRTKYPTEPTLELLVVIASWRSWILTILRGVIRYNPLLSFVS